MPGSFQRLVSVTKGPVPIHIARAAAAHQALASYKTPTVWPRGYMVAMDLGSEPRYKDVRCGEQSAIYTILLSIFIKVSSWQVQWKLLAGE